MRRNELISSVLLVLLAIVLASAAVTARGGDARGATPPVESGSPAADAPAPLAFPADDGPHAASIEWWYYTGHLFAESGDRYGFEFVVFKGKRGGLTGYASHFAVTDNVGGEFRYDERFVPDEAVSSPVTGGGFDFRFGDWRMRGADGADRLVASMPGYAISLATRATKPPSLHDGDGYVDYGSGQGSYYYSRTRLEVTGAISVDGEPMEVSGEAWFDHQWGSFTIYEDGGWDWFALQFDDGWDLMLQIVRAPDGSTRVAVGSLVSPQGALTVLDGEEFAIEPVGEWTSPTTGVSYPSGWRVSLTRVELDVVLAPALLDQEMDTRATTGQLYWEGEVTIAGTRAGSAIGGLGYVELTDYADRGLTAPAAWHES
jgi:predicted secreted hydrolase